MAPKDREDRPERVVYEEVGLEVDDTCEDDTARCGRFREPGEPERVLLRITETETGDDAAVLISPAKARRLAAALLTSADEIEGLTPLCFQPPSPDATYPPKHPSRRRRPS